MVYNLDGSLTVFWDAAHKLLNISSSTLSLSLQFFNKEFVLSAAAQARPHCPYFIFSAPK